MQATTRPMWGQHSHGTRTPHKHWRVAIQEPNPFLVVKTHWYFSSIKIKTIITLPCQLEASYWSTTVLHQLPVLHPQARLHSLSVIPTWALPSAFLLHPVFILWFPAQHSATEPITASAFSERFAVLVPAEQTAKTASQSQLGHGGPHLGPGFHWWSYPVYTYWKGHPSTRALWV